MTMIILLITTLVVIVLLCIFGVDYLISNQTNQRIYAEVEQVPPHQVALILGTSKSYQGRINEYFLYRCQAGAELIKAQKVEFLLVSGDNSSTYYNEPQDFKNCLVELGVPAERIYLDYAGFRTIDSIIRAKEVFGLSEFIIVSQKFHLQRAIFTADRFGLKTVGYQAQDVSSAKNHARIRLREVLARTNLLFDLLTNKQPKFLGEPIVIR